MKMSRVTRSKQEAKRTYDRISRWYDLLTGGFERKLCENGVRKLDAQAGQVILEIGFGTGHALVRLAKAVGRRGKVHGIDLSEGMLAVSRSRLAKEGVSEVVFLERGDAAQMPFEQAFFDGIFSSFTLELFDTPEIPRVLAECMRTLRAGGRICIVAMSKKRQPNVMTWLYERMHERLPQVIDCRPIYVAHALEQAGFQILEAAEDSLFGLGIETVLAVKPSPGK